MDLPICEGPCFGAALLLWEEGVSAPAARTGRPAAQGAHFFRQGSRIFQPDRCYAASMPEFRRLANDVYAFLQPPLICYSSVGVIIGDRDVIVVDSLTNAVMTQSLLAEIRCVTEKPIRFLINTHSHFDHVYTNHLFPQAIVISTHRGREETRANHQVQSKHDALFARLFPDVDLAGGCYTPQEMSFNGSLTLYQGDREIRVLELGVGHSESDVVVHLPGEKIVFCGDIFMNGMPPLPGEGRVTQTIAHYKAIEALEAEIYVAGHGDPGTLADVCAQRDQLAGQFQRARECFDRGMSYDEALQAFANDPIPLDYQRLIILASYWEFAGKRPETTDPVSQNHMTMLQGIAAEARLRLRRQGWS
jgi:glyoxylase-like metal-dependent hydrolase (beta-lactamase superfamily II)